MITFCTGNSSLKRRIFRSAGGEGVINVDNDEILATFNLSGKLYVVVGEIPYGNMTLEQFIACSRALVTRLPLKRASIRGMLIAAGLLCSPKKRLCRVSRVQYRAAVLASKLELDTKTIYVNFDGLEYNSKNKRELYKFLTLWGRKYEIFAAVSDTRFIPKSGPVINYTEDGADNKKVRVEGKIVSGFSFRKRLAKSGMDINLPAIKKVVVL